MEHHHAAEAASHEMLDAMLAEDTLGKLDAELGEELQQLRAELAEGEEDAAEMRALMRNLKSLAAKNRGARTDLSSDVAGAGADVEGPCGDRAGSDDDAEGDADGDGDDGSFDLHTLDAELDTALKQFRKQLDTMKAQESELGSARELFEARLRRMDQLAVSRARAGSGGSGSSGDDSESGHIAQR